jgi:tetratricopeptide (TPR) repeat protein
MCKIYLIVEPEKSECMTPVTKVWRTFSIVVVSTKILILGITTAHAQTASDNAMRGLFSYFNSLAVYAEDTASQKVLGTLGQLYNTGTSIHDAANGRTAPNSDGNSAGMGAGVTGGQVNTVSSATDLTNRLSGLTDDPATKQLLGSAGLFTDAGINISNAISNGGITAVELNGTALDLVNNIAGYTTNPKLQELATNLNQLHSGMGQIKSDLNSVFGMDAVSNEAAAITEGVFAGLMVIDALTTKAEPTPGEKATRAFMTQGEESVKAIYKECISLHALNTFNDKVLVYLSGLEQRLDNYDLATARQRLLLLRYYSVKGVPEPPEIQQWWVEINNDFQTKGLDHIKAEVNRRTGTNSPEHLKNSEQAFAGLRSEILLYKSQYHYKNGNEAEAMRLTTQLAENSNYEDKKAAVDKWFDERNYKMAAQIYPSFFAHWYKSMNKLMYDEDLLKRGQVNNEVGTYFIQGISTLGKGIVALAKNGQYNNAAAHLEQVRAIQNDYLLKPKKKSRYHDYILAELNTQSVNAEKGTEKMYFLHAESEILKSKGLYAEAMVKIDSAIHHAQTSTQMYVGKAWTYSTILKESRIDLLIYQKNFDKALSEVMALQRTYGANYDVTNVKFMQALIFYNMGKIQPALSSLTVIKSMNENIPKVYVLEKEIYTSMNDMENAQKAQNKLISIINQNQ